jgi:hypothetical protein
MDSLKKIFLINSFCLFLILAVALCGCTENVRPIDNSSSSVVTNTTILPRHTYVSSPSHTSDLYNITISTVNTKNESVRISNRGTAEVSLYGWTLKTKSGNLIYSFPEYSLKPGDEVTVFLNKSGQNSREELYVTERVLNGSIDAIELYDELQNQID